MYCRVGHWEVVQLVPGAGSGIGLSGQLEGGMVCRG